MFFNTELLTKRGSLSKVWMASHLSTKLSKSNLLATSIPTSVSSILGEALLPMALRLSGQLLLGVARIYSRKTKYLLDDCNETLAKVKKAFKPGQVDLDAADANAGGRKDAITLRAEPGALEDLLNADNYWDVNFDLTTGNATPGPSRARQTGTQAKANTSARADITLAEDHDFGYDNFDAYGNGGAVEFDYGEGGGIDSMDVGGLGEEEEGFGLDLGLDDLLGDDVDLGIGGSGAHHKHHKRPFSEVDGEGEEDRSVEMGRDAQIHASDRGSVAAFDLSMDKSVGTGGADEDLGGMGDTGFEFDYGGGGGEEEQREQTPVPQVNGSTTGESFALTPKTAKNLAAANANKKQKTKKQVIIDRSIELEWEDQKAVAARRGDLFTEPHYLPRSRTHLRLLERAADPSYYFSKSFSDNNATSTFTFTIPGLAPELQSLFKLPSRRALIRAEKRRRSPSVAEGDVDVELGRKRAATAEFHDFGDYNPNDNGEYGGGGEEDLGGFEDGGFGGDDSFKFDLGEDQNAPAVTAKASQPQKKRPRVEDDGPVLDYDDLAVGSSGGPLSIFDDARSLMPTEAQTATQSLGEEDENAAMENGSAVAPGKWSKNTFKAVSVLKSEFSQDDAELDFEVVANKATKRAAASFFFELLVLSTRDCIKVQQQEAFGPIHVAAKDKLWAIGEQAGRSTQVSV